MTTEMAQLLERVQAELGDLIDILDRDGPSYAQRYAEHMTLRPTATHAPQRPAGMPPIAATIVKEIVLDELAAGRHRQSSLVQRRIGGAR